MPSPTFETGRAPRVAHICTSGIAYQILRDKLRLLHERGYEVTLISSEEGTSAAMLAACPFRWLLVPMSRAIEPLSDLRSIAALSRLLRRERFDIVHTHTAKAGLIGRVAARIAGVRSIVHTSHGLPFYDGQPRLTYQLYRLLEKLAALFCDALASQNAEDAAALRRLAPWRPVYTEGNGVDLERLDRLAAGVTEGELAALRDAHGIARDRPVLLMAARFEPVKDHHLLLDAMRLVKQRRGLVFTTVLAGKGPLAAEIRERVVAEGLAGDVVFVGQQRCMVPWLKLADAATLTSAKEGIPRFLMEAMALGKPVLATDVLGTRELVVHGETGVLVPYRRADRLADALEGLLAAPDALLRMGAAGRRRIEAEFTEARVVDRLHHMYRETEARAARAS